MPLGNLLTHWRLGNVKWRCAAVFATAGVLGAFVGSTVAKALDGEKLLALFGIVMVIVGAVMLRRRDAGGNPEVRLTTDTAKELLPMLLGIGFAVGRVLRLLRDRRRLPDRAGPDARDRHAAYLRHRHIAGRRGRLRSGDRRQLRDIGLVDWWLAGLFVAWRCCRRVRRDSSRQGPRSDEAGAGHRLCHPGDRRRALRRRARRHGRFRNRLITALARSNPCQHRLPLNGKPIVKGFFEKRTSSVQYVVADPETKRAAIIDPVLDFDPKSGATATHSADELLAHVEREGYTLEWILDTHPHADHFSAAGYLKDKTGVPTAIGEKVVEVQKLWKDIYNLPDSFPTDGSQWDRLFTDGERFKIGNLDVEVMFTPGHTLASIAYVIGDAAFIHDTIFMPDGGTARADFPGGTREGPLEQHPAHHGVAGRDASVHRPRLLPGRPGAAMGKHRRRAAGENTHLTKAKTEEEFVALAREARPGAADAEADPTFAAGEHPRRAVARARREWQALSQDPARCA